MCHRQGVPAGPTQAKPPFFYICEPFKAYVRSSNIVPKKQSNTKNFVMELSKISRKGTKKNTYLRRKQPHVAPPAFGEFRLAQVSIPQVPQAAHEVFGVVRLAEFAGIWCNSATFQHLDITRVYRIHIYS